MNRYFSTSTQLKLPLTFCVLANPYAVGALALRLLRRGTWPPSLYSAVECLQWAIALAERAAAHPAELLALVLSELQQVGDLAEQSLRRMGQEMAYLVRHLEHAGTRLVDEVTEHEVRDFIAGPVRVGRQWSFPAIATQHLRLGAARLYFKTGRRIGVCQGDPTEFIRLQPRSSLRARAATDQEVYECRAASKRTLFETRLPAALAIAEACGTTSEQAAAVVGDVDFDGNRIRLHDGGRNRVPRWGTLTPWGAEALRRRIEVLGPSTSPQTKLVYAGRAGPESGQASACKAIFDIMQAAGLGAEPDLRPSSIPAWAARRIFDANGGRIEEVALALGVKLDTAAAVIGWDWRG